MAPAARLGRPRARAYKIPTDSPEADGTLRWDSTTLVVVELDAGAARGIGYTYADASLVMLINAKLADIIEGRDAFDIPGAIAALQRAIRNLGRAGLVATAMAAIDGALWDVKAKLLGIPLASLLGRSRDHVPIYGSGGFTSYSDDQLRDQLAGWAERDGCRWVKMKVGSDPDLDPHRVEVARRALGSRGLFVDANGAYEASKALALGEIFHDYGVTWFEEPVSSDDLSGLHLLRQQMPPEIEVAAGEYGYTIDYFERMLAARAVGCLQADASRCGISGFLGVAALCAGHHIELSGHCAPALHLAVACAAPALRHLEWFHDHVRIEHMLFDGAPTPQHGAIAPDLSRPGLGIEFKGKDAERFLVAE